MDNELANLFSKLISNPNALNGIKDIINNSTNVETKDSANNVGDFSTISDMLNNDENNEFVSKISSIYNSFNNNSNPGFKLIEALSPFLSSRRMMNIEKVKNLMRMSNVISELNKR